VGEALPPPTIVLVIVLVLVFSFFFADLYPDPSNK
jgi:hypothetical protein